MGPDWTRITNHHFGSRRRIWRTRIAGPRQQPLLCVRARSARRPLPRACAHRSSGPLDYSEKSLRIVTEALGEAADYTDVMTPEQRKQLAQDFGSYVLEVARQNVGGRYLWFDKRDQPVLVYGEPAFRIALITWDCVEGRLTGDKAYDIEFLYKGFADRARTVQPGDDALYV